MTALDDPRRLEAIRALDLQSDEARALMDGAAARAAEVLGVPVGLVSIVLGDAQWFAGQSGLDGWLHDVAGTPIEWSFCAHVVGARAPLTVADAHRDARFAENPLVTGELVASYAGVPLVAPSGEVLGSLCGLSKDQKKIAGDALERLSAIASELMAALVARAPRER